MSKEREQFFYALQEGRLLGQIELLKEIINNDITECDQGHWHGFLSEFLERKEKELAELLFLLTADATCGTIKE